MKTIFLLSILSLAVFSCKDHDDEQQITDVFAKKIDSVKIPMDTMALGVTQQIKVYSTFTKSCEGIYNYTYNYTNDSVRTVANYAFKTNDPCANTTYVDGSRINFKPEKPGKFTFKFFAGKDANGANSYIEKNIVVNN